MHEDISGDVLIDMILFFNLRNGSYTDRHSANRDIRVSLLSEPS